MKNSGYIESEVPPSQDLEDDDPTVYQVSYEIFKMHAIQNLILSGVQLELESHVQVKASVLWERENNESESSDPCQCSGIPIF